MRRTPLVLVADECHECYEYVYHTGESVLWDITLAKTLVAQRDAGLAVVPIEQMALVAERYDYDEARVAQADPSIPGIAAPIRVDGQINYIIIDGIHRCVRAYRTGAAFMLQVMTDEDSRACVVRATPGVLP